MFLVIDLEFSGSVKKIVPHYLRYEGDEAHLRYIEKCDDDKYDKHENRQDDTYAFGSSLERVEYSHRCSYSDR